VETTTTDDGADVERTLVRYQLSDRLGSALVELDEAAAILSYEEYHPFGSTAYQAVRSALEASPKRYRHTGRERDVETGFSYHGARYYAPWLGRWASTDPAGTVDGPNLYRYARNNPVRLTDPQGTQPNEPTPFSSAGSGPLLSIDSTGRFHFGVPSDPRYCGYQWFMPQAPAAAQLQLQLLTPAPVGGGGTTTGGPGGAPAAASPTVAAAPAPAGGAGGAAAPPSTPDAVPNLFDPTRFFLRGWFHPSAPGGAPLSGPLNTWSGGGLPAAQAAPGYIMGQTQHHQDALNLLRSERPSITDPDTWFPAAGDTAGQELFDRAWTGTSRAVGRGAGLSETPVRSFGLDDYHLRPPPPGAPPRSAANTVQSTTELPAIQRWGLLPSGLGVASGALTLWNSDHWRDPGTRNFARATGALEVGGGLSYGLGAAAVRWGAITMPTLARYGTYAMTAGRVMGTAGGVAQVVLGVAQVAQDLEAHDTRSAVIHAGGAIGGALLLIGASSGVGLVVIAGAFLVGIALGYDIGRMFR
jgi:RHS repeat-associated protein